MLALINKIKYLLRETWSGLRRGGWMNWAAISTVMVLLFLFGICVQTSWQLDALLEHFGTQLEVSVYLEPETEGREIQPLVAELPYVEAVRLVPKEEAWPNLLRELGITDVTAATEQLEGNPLVDELKVVATDLQQISWLMNRIESLPGIDRAVHLNEATDRFGQIQQSLNGVSIVVTVVLSLTAIAVITTTLNLIAIARRNELEIMQLVGATKTWIVLPFMLHGIIFGTVGAGLALVLMWALRMAIAQILTTQTGFLQFLTEGLTLTPIQLHLLPVIVVTLGITIGMVGSLFAIRRVAML
ncbi:MAG: ABC transporter permease [Spirulina sp. SIO3F2]|nr:ABC transporter permease [Spirulina sp. SIO3F2]